MAHKLLARLRAANKTIRVHKIALDPNNVQLGSLARSAGVARFAYNWALAEWERQYKAGEKPNEGKLRRQLNAIKHSDFPWMLDVSKTCPQQAIKNLGAAYARAFDNLKKRRRVGGKKNPWGFPRFKKKGRGDSFRADNGPETVAVEGCRIRLPVIGWMRMHEELRFSGKIKSATVSRTANRWFVAVSVEVEDQPKTSENQAVIGVDLGVKTMAVCSDGRTFEAPKALPKCLKRLKRLQRIESRRRKSSANRKKAAARVAKLHARIANIRKDALHKATTAIVRSAGVVVLEDLNVRGMMAKKLPGFSFAISHSRQRHHEQALRQDRPGDHARRHREGLPLRRRSQTEEALYVQAVPWR